MGQDTALEIVKSFEQALISLGVEIDRLILFGSYATGTVRQDSDIDVIVISPSFAEMDYWERIDVLSEAIYRVSAPIEATAFTPEEWRRGDSLLVDFAKNGVTVA